MDIKVIASTKVGEAVSREEFDLFGGRAAGVCYMSSTFDDLWDEDKEKTRRRIKQTKTGGHHSVYEHSLFSMYLNGIPKIIAMIINNEKQYTTSEKSGRYTKMVLTPKEQAIYDKWLEIFRNKITKLYAEQYGNFFTPSRIEKLAQENARYTTSVFTPISMIYTVNYRQFNYLVSFIDGFIAKENKNNFENKLNPYMEEFARQLKELPYYDEELAHNEKCRALSLFTPEDRRIEEYFGDVYCTTYNASFAEFAHAQRHRTLSYSMKVKPGEFYIPELLRDSESYVELWLSDLKELQSNYPNATLLEVNEMGTFDNFVLKMKERKCTYVLLETNRVTNETLKKYEHALKMKVHPRADEISQYTKGSRCTFPDFKCTAPCGFILGINETRKI